MLTVYTFITKAVVCGSVQDLHQWFALPQLSSWTSDHLLVWAKSFPSLFCNRVWETWSHLSGYVPSFCQILHNLLQTLASMAIKQNPLLYIVGINHLQIHPLAEELFAALLVRQMDQTSSSHYVCTHLSFTVISSFVSTQTVDNTLCFWRIRLLTA